MGFSYKMPPILKGRIVRLFRFSCLAVCPHRKFLPPGTGPLSFYKDPQVVFTSQEHNMLLLFCQVHAQCPHTLGLLNVPFSIQLLQTQLCASHRQKAERWGGRELLRPHGWCPPLLLTWTICCHSHELSDLSLGRLLGRIPWVGGGASLLPLQEMRGFAGLFLQWFFSQFILQFFEVPGVRGVGALLHCVNWRCDLGQVIEPLQIRISSFVDRELGC